MARGTTYSAADLTSRRARAGELRQPTNLVSAAMALMGKSTGPKAPPDCP